jgi:penicillin-binding protein 2
MRGHPGAVVAMDPRDGAVLAYVSAPTYDLNHYAADYNTLMHDPQRQLINRVSGSYYPCGSPFKLVTAVAGLASGALSPATRDYCSGQIKLGSRIFHCDKRAGHGAIGFEDAIGQSCDIFFWHAAERIGPEAIADWARKFGMGARTGIDLPVDVKGVVPDPDWKRKRRHGPWVPGDTLNMAIGQGYVGVTPLQLAVMASAIANGGAILKPQTVREIVDTSTGRVIRRLQPRIRSRLGLEADARDAIVEGMRRAMLAKGTAEGSAIPGLEIAGKTGTAEAYSHGRRVSHSVFICFAPIGNPVIAVAVLVEGGGYGSDVAAPIARRVLNAYFNLHLDDNTVPIGKKHTGGD